MEGKRRDVIIENDEGDSAFAQAAPLLVEALQLVASTRALPLSLESACREMELVRVNCLCFAYRSARQEAQELRERLNPHLDSVYTAFSYLCNVSEPSSHHHHPRKQQERQMYFLSLLHCHDGLVCPNDLRLTALLQSQPVFEYTTFRKHYNRLCQIIADGQLFSACEPRILVLRSRYRMHRVLNGAYEDATHPTLGGGSFTRAAKVDVRRIGSCMSARTLEHFMQELLLHEPDIVLPTRHALSVEDEGGKKLRAEVEETESGHQSDSSASQQTERDPTLRELVEVFFGPFLSPEERCFTAAGMGLVPNYTETAPRGVDISENHQAAPLLRHFLDIYSGNKGALLSRLVMPMLSRIAQSERDVLELEFTVTGLIAGEVEHIATWCVKSELISSPNIQISLHIAQRSLKTGDPECTAKTLEDVLRNIFGPIWLALLHPQEYSHMVNFLRRLVSVALSVSGHAEMQETPVTSDPKIYSSENGNVPPDALFIYHIWRNVQLLNCMVATHLFFATPGEKDVTASAFDTGNTLERRTKPSDFFLPQSSPFRGKSPILSQPLRLRLHASAVSENSFVESILGLLLADEVVNPAEVFTWSPLAYLYYLTQRSILVTPSQNHTAPCDAALHRAVPFLVETGLNGAIATLHPLHYHSVDNALQEEFNTLLKNFRLSMTDITEMCLHTSARIQWGADKRYAMLGSPRVQMRARHNEFKKTQVHSLRLQFRETVLAHEMDLLCRKGLTEKTVMHSLRQKRQQQRKGEEEDQGNVENSFLGFPLPPEGEVWLPYAVKAKNTFQTLRTTIWEFFDIPPKSTEYSELSTFNTLKGSFVDRLIEFPRIVFPRSTREDKSTEAQTIVRALLRRQYYQGFNAHCEVALEKKVLSNEQMLEALRIVQGEATATSTFNLTNLYQKQQQPSYIKDSSRKMCTSSVVQGQQINIPTSFHCVDGVRDVALLLYANEATKNYFCSIPTWKEFQSDVRQLRTTCAARAVQRFSKKRLEMLECKFNLHAALTNDDQEHRTHGVPSFNEKEDLYRCIKVDVHCHMAAGMTAKELLNFIQKKMHTHANDVVDIEPDTGREITLSSMFKNLRAPRMQDAFVNVKELSVASLEVKAGKSTFNRFDEYNGRYSPLGHSSLRSLLLKTDNFMGGRYFAELIRQTFHRQEEDKYIFSEYRLSIYGRHRDEWDKLARWFVLHGMAHPTNRWMVQIPRLYSIYRKNGSLSSFDEMLTNIFLPLWEASIFPEAHPFLNYFLMHVSGFDSVDNESEREPDVPIHISPASWTSTENPPFVYWVYYMWANITTLNRYRAAKGLSTFTFRPHAGESGDPGHMADVFLVVDGVNHGINLKDLPVMQYLYYLTQIPLGITPLSNNALFCKYQSNPFPNFFRRGLNVALATDAALVFHHTEQPLIEEYSTAANFWDLSRADLCEIARNSVLMSGFSSKQKRAWLGDLYFLRSAAGNDVCSSKVPQTRCTFRYEVYLDEFNYLQSRGAVCVPVRPIMDAQTEELYVMDVTGLTRADIIQRRLCGRSVSVVPSTLESKGGFVISRPHVGGLAAVTPNGQCSLATSKL